MTACRHEGPHWVLWNHLYGYTNDTQMWRAIETALIHADTEYCGLQIQVCNELVERAKKLHKAQPMEIDDYEMACIMDAVGDGCEYMLDNHYDDQRDYEAGDNPEDVVACSALQRGEFVWTCWRDLWFTNPDGTEKDWRSQLPASEALALGYRPSKERPAMKSMPPPARKVWRYGEKEYT